MYGTVKQFLDTLDEMRTIYPFNDEETRLSTYSPECDGHCSLNLVTQDKETGVWVNLSKRVYSDEEVF